MKKRITCWYRVVDGVPQWNHFEYDWTDRNNPLSICKKQAQMWKDVEWCKTYGYLTDGVVKASWLLLVLSKKRKQS